MIIFYLIFYYLRTGLIFIRTSCCISLAVRTSAKAEKPKYELFFFRETFNRCQFSLYRFEYVVGIDCLLQMI